MSPSDTAFDVEDKVRTYLKAGVRFVWVIYPNTKTVHVYHGADQALLLSGNDVLKGEDELTGFQMPLAELFSEPASTSS